MKLLLNPLIITIIGGIIVALFCYFVLGIGKTEINPEEISITDSFLYNSPVIQNSQEISIEYNEYKQIPFNIPIIMSLDPSKFKNFDFLNTKFVLPDGSEAFISRMSHGKEYIIAYKNDDCSDFYVSEKYKMMEEIQTEDLCFIITSFPF